jgi:molecular chaperone HscB
MDDRLNGLDLAASDFALFGLPERFGLDPAALEATWKALQGVAHPDRHAGASPAAQRLAMQWAVRINEAYRRLKDPLARAAALCALHGADVAAETNTAMPPAFLMRQLEWREALEDARGADAVEAIADEVLAERRATLERLRARIDDAPDADWPAVAETVRGLMFVDRFLADVDRRLEAFQD